MRAGSLGSRTLWFGVVVLVLVALTTPAFGDSSRGSANELFAGELGRWLQNDAIPELAVLVGKHPRFQGEQIRVVTMAGGRPALGSNQLSAAVRDQLTHRLTQIKGVQIAWQTGADRCGVPRNTPYLLGVEITSESRSRSLVTIAMADVEEGIWVSGGYLQWRGVLTQQERHALARLVASAPAGTIDSPLPGDRHNQISALLLKNIECALRGGLDGDVQVAVANSGDELLTAVAERLREALSRSATVVLVNGFDQANSSGEDGADWLLELRLSSDIGEAVIATLAPNNQASDTGRQRLAAVYVRQAGQNTVVSPGASPVVSVAPSTLLIEDLHEVPVKPGDRCYARSAECLEVQLDLSAPSYLLVLRTQPGGSLNLGSCARPRRVSGTKRYRLQIREGGAGFYAVATTDSELAARLHRQLAAGASNCGDRGRSDWLTQFEATLASAKSTLDWRAFYAAAGEKSL